MIGIGSVKAALDAFYGDDPDLSSALEAFYANFDASEDVNLFITELVQQVPVMAKHFISHAEFQSLLPDDPGTQESWGEFDQTNVTKVLAKFKSGAVIAVQSDENEWHGQLSYDQFIDDTVEHMNSIGHVVAVDDEAVQPFKFEPEQMPRLRKFFQDIQKSTMDINMTKIIFKAALNNIRKNHGMNAENGGGELDFRDSQFMDDYLTSISSASEIMQANAEAFCTKVYLNMKGVVPQEVINQLGKEVKQSRQSLLEEDRALLREPVNVFEMQSPVGSKDVILARKTEDTSASEKKKGVLITTCESGGCHINIAKQVSEALIASDVPCVVLNETQLQAKDTLSHFIPLSFAQLYPVVHQKAGQADYRNHLKELSSQLEKYMPDMRASRLRLAVDDISQEMDVGSLYITSHYAHNYRFAPEKSDVYFQVCDFGTGEALPEAPKSLLEATAYTKSVKFVTGSPVAHTEEHTEKGDFIYTEVPVVKISEKEAKNRFVDFAAEHGLDEKADRALLLMGGVGCGPLIEGYVDKIIDGYNSQPISGRKPLEFIVCCGNNKELQKEIIEQIKEKMQPQSQYV